VRGTEPVGSGQGHPPGTTHTIPCGGGYPCGVGSQHNACSFRHDDCFITRGSAELQPSHSTTFGEDCLGRRAVQRNPKTLANATVQCTPSQNFLFPIHHAKEKKMETRINHEYRYGREKKNAAQDYSSVRTSLLRREEYDAVIRDCTANYGNLRERKTADCNALRANAGGASPRRGQKGRGH